MTARPKKYSLSRGNNNISPQRISDFFSDRSPSYSAARKKKQRLFRFKFQEEIDQAVDGAAFIAKIKKLRKNSPRRVLILQTLYESMARISELLNLEVQDLNPKEAVLLIRFGKGGKERLVPISHTLATDLAEYIGNRLTTPATYVTISFVTEFAVMIACIRELFLTSL